ncbi:MAG: hypothetical protein AB1566_03630 [Chloroflexota bacterium]
MDGEEPHYAFDLAHYSIGSSLVKESIQLPLSKTASSWYNRPETHTKKGVEMADVLTVEQSDLDQLAKYLKDIGRPVALEALLRRYVEIMLERLSTAEVESQE